MDKSNPGARERFATPPVVETYQTSQADLALLEGKQPASARMDLNSPSPEVVAMEAAEAARAATLQPESGVQRHKMHEGFGHVALAELRGAAEFIKRGVTRNLGQLALGLRADRSTDKHRSRPGRITTA